MSATATKKATPVRGVTEQLAAVVRRFVALSPEPAGCRACAGVPCAVHQLRKDAQEALRALDAPES